MASLSEMLKAHNYINPTAPDTGTSGFGEFANVMMGRLKEQEDEKRRQDNVKKQMSQAQEMMKAMAGMKDNSSSAKAIGSMDNDVEKRRRGVITVDDYVPSQEIGVGEDGMPYQKISIKSATPQEQKAQFEMKKSQVEMEKAQAKSDLLGAYVKGEVKEGAILGEMSTLGITADEFDIASQARQRLQSMPQGVPQGFEATEMNRDRMGNMIPSGIKKIQPPMSPVQPTTMDALKEEQARLNIEKTKRELESQQTMVIEQPLVEGKEQPKQEGQPIPFRFKTDKTVAEQKFDLEQQGIQKGEQEKIVRAKDNAEKALNAIKEIRNSIGYFGRIDAHLPATPGTEKVAWTKNVDRVKAMLTLDNLMELKSASKNGASGLGALSDGERRMLEDAASALDRGLPKEKAEQYLNEIENTLTRVLGGESKQEASGSVPSVGGTFNGEKVISVKRIR